jgi:hypothetical protein
MNNEEKKKDEIKIMTYNVNFENCYEPDIITKTTIKDYNYNNNCKKIVDCILESNADIGKQIFIKKKKVCLQETNEFFEYYFNQKLKEDYPNQIFKHRVNGYYASGTSIITKKDFEIKKIKMVKPNVEDTYFTHMIAFVEHNNTVFEIINVHLVPPLSISFIE